MSKSGANLPTGPQKMTPSEAFVETMVANKVKDIFGIMGSAFMDAMDIFAPAGIRLIPVVHEQGEAHRTIQDIGLEDRLPLNNELSRWNLQCL